MNRALVKGILVGGAAVVVFDVVASLLSRSFAFSYSYAMPGSFAIYAMVGYLTARNSNLGFAVLAGAAAGAIDATLGWELSRLIGPGRRAGVQITPLIWFVTFWIVSMTAAFFSTIGGLIGWARRRSAA